MKEVGKVQKSIWPNLIWWIFIYNKRLLVFPGVSVVKNACNEGDLGSIPGLERSPREGSGNLLQCFCLGNPTDRGAWQATVYGVEKNQTWLTDLTTTTTTIKRPLDMRFISLFLYNYKTLSGFQSLDSVIQDSSYYSLLHFIYICLCICNHISA